MTTAHDAEPAHRSSATARVLDRLELYGYQPSGGEPDPRPLPEPELVTGAISDLFDILTGALRDTALEPDLDELLWHLTDLFHKKAARVQRQLDDNEDRQRKGQGEQDGSEVRSVELERLVAEGEVLIERRDAFEHMRDSAAERYEAETGSAWRPRAGSLVNHRHLTAAMIDSRDFIAARRRNDAELLLPKGPKIAFSGGADCADHKLIWAVLDKVLAKHPDMVLIHGGTPKGAEKAAACWADKRGVTQIAFKPDWTRRQGGAVQAQRPHARHRASRRHRLPRLRHHRQSRRQSQAPRHPRARSPGGRRVAAPFPLQAKRHHNG